MVPPTSERSTAREMRLSQSATESYKSASASYGACIRPLNLLLAIYDYTGALTIITCTDLFGFCLSKTLISRRSANYCQISF